MLKDVIDFIISNTGLKREDALRSINYAWRELYNSDDLPNSLFELSIKLTTPDQIISLPWYVGEMRAVKICGKRINLETPRPYYQDATYYQSPWTWRVLGTSPLNKNITNATRLNLSFTQPVTQKVVVTIIGPADNSTETREQITFEIGETTKENTVNFTDITSLTKDIITDSDLSVRNAEDEIIATLANSQFESKSIVIQIYGKDVIPSGQVIGCYDILYKKTCPYLYHDETPVPFQESVMAKAMEWITLPKEKGSEKAVLYADKSRTLLSQYNGNERAIQKKLDIGQVLPSVRYVGFI